jgi:uncharacterized protein YceH (UPF0502 family)
MACMWSEQERLSRLTDVSERVCDMRKMAARLEPVAEEMAEEARGSVYNHGVLPAEGDPKQARAEAEAETEQIAALASDLSKAIEEVRDLSDRLEGHTAAARARWRRHS